MCKEGTININYAGYVERLQVQHEQLKARCSVLEQSCVAAREFAEEAFSFVEKTSNEMTALQEENLALAARVELLERQLKASDTENHELEAALIVAQLSPDSQSNVIDLLKRTAA